MESFRDCLSIEWSPTVQMWELFIGDFSFGFFREKEAAEHRGEYITDAAAALCYLQTLGAMPLPAASERYEYDRITLAMRTAANQTEAARNLGMPRQTLNEKLGDRKNGVLGTTDGQQPVTDR